MRLGEIGRFLNLYKRLGLSDLEAMVVMLVVVGYELSIQPSFAYLRQKLTAGEEELEGVIARFVARGWLRPLGESEKEYDGLKLVHLFNQWVITAEEAESRAGDSKGALKTAVTEVDLIEAELWFERSFRARLTPMQKEEVHRLVKEYGKDLVLEALRQAVLNNKLTLSYIGSILRRWRREDWNTVFEVRKALEAGRPGGELKERRRGTERADLDQYEELMELLMRPREEMPRAKRKKEEKKDSKGKGRGCDREYGFK